MGRKLSGIEPGLRQTFRELIAGRAPWPLFLHGPAGRGKTCAALCLTDYAGGWYRTLPDLLDEVVTVQQGKAYTKGHIQDGGGQVVTVQFFWDEVAREPLFVLDEVGCRDVVTDHHYLTLKRLLDRREGRPLVVLSNLDLEQLARLYDDRISSRLAAGTVVQLDGQDRRLRR